MSKLPIFELFINVGNLKPKLQVVYKTKTEAKLFHIELPPCDVDAGVAGGHPLAPDLQRAHPLPLDWHLGDQMM